jgi:hypothetical protein
MVSGGSLHSEDSSQAPDSPSIAPVSKLPAVKLDSLPLLPIRTQAMAFRSFLGKSSSRIEHGSKSTVLRSLPASEPTVPALGDNERHSEPTESDDVDAKLREILSLLMSERQNENLEEVVGNTDRGYERFQVLYLVSNYFVLFLSLVAASAEIQSRLPNWMSWMEAQHQSIQDCAKDEQALFVCISNGDLSGLIASVLLWMSRSFATKRVFLFGFESTKQVWNVVYESFIVSCCWGITYLFIQRGMNPQTRSQFIRKYWKDAVYGSLAGFHAAFLKQILKNLIPKEAVEDAWQERQTRFFEWLSTFD